MGLRNMSLLTGATVSSTGGVALVFADNGVTIQNGVQVVVAADTDYQTRRSLTAKVRPAGLDPKTNVYGKDKKSVSYTIPQVLSNGSVVFNVIRIEREVHPACSAANALDLNKIGAQLLTNSNMDNFWLVGSVQ